MERKFIVTHISLISFTGKSTVYKSAELYADICHRTGQLKSACGTAGSIWHMPMANAMITVTSDFILGHEALIRFEGPEDSGFVRGTINFGFNKTVLAISCWPSRESGLHGGCSTKLYTSTKTTPQFLKGKPL